MKSATSIRARRDQSVLRFVSSRYERDSRIIASNAPIVALALRMADHLKKQLAG